MISLFLSQYCMILLLGLQSLFVKDLRVVHAAVTSLLLSITGWICTGTIAQVYSQGMISWAFFSFAIAGPLGISTSIWLYGKQHNITK